jgi:transposase-like protein
LAERGVEVDPSCIWRWMQAYAPELNKRCRPHLKSTNKSYRTDETYIKVKGEDKYLYRAVDSAGQTIEFLLTAKRHAAAARRFFRKARGVKQRYYPMLGFGAFRSAQRFCQAFEEVRQYFRPRRKRKQIISLAQRRRRFVAQAQALESMFLAA